MKERARLDRGFNISRRTELNHRAGVERNTVIHANKSFILDRYILDRNQENFEIVEPKVYGIIGALDKPYIVVLHKLKDEILEPKRQFYNITDPSFGYHMYLDNIETIHFRNMVNMPLEDIKPYKIRLHQFGNSVEVYGTFNFNGKDVEFRLPEVERKYKNQFERKSLEAMDIYFKEKVSDKVTGGVKI